MKRLYVITKQLEHGMPLIRGKGYLSNAHWLMRWPAVAQPVLAPMKRSKLTIARLTKSATGKVRRVRVHRTGERYVWNKDGVQAKSDLHASVCYANASGTLEVWLSAYYVKHLGLPDVLYAIDPHTVVTERAKGWRVALLPMRPPNDKARTRPRKRGRRC